MIKFEKNEKIIMEARRHWFVIYTFGAFILFLVLIPIIIILVALAMFPDIMSFMLQPKITAAMVVFGALWTWIMWIFFFVAWTNYYLDVLVVTNQRLIDVEQKGLFARDVATMPLEKVQDIKIEVKGIIRTLLKFGELHIQTAGFSKELVVRDINEPAKVKQTIMSAYHQGLTGQE